MRITLILFFLLSIQIHSQDGSELLLTAQDLFLNNKPAQAITWFELALDDNPGNSRIYAYLGIAYEQIGESFKAIQTYTKGMDYAGDLKGVFLTNIGNNKVILGKYSEAIEYYTKAVNLDQNSDALRNRAGEYLRQGQYDNALTDYRLYLTLEASPYQENEIKRVIKLLENTIDDIAMQKLEGERRRLEEEARQAELLNQVLNSLSSAGKNTTNLSAGTESVEGYQDDFDIVD